MFFKKGDQVNDYEEFLEGEQLPQQQEEEKKRFRLSSTVKRNIAVVGSVALIGGAVALNWYLFSGETPVDAGDEGVYYQSQSGEEQNAEYVAGNDGDTDSYFASTQISRQRARDEAIEVLQLVVENTEAQADVKAQAMADISAIAANIETEANIETIITSKGFEQCVAVLGDEMISIIVRTGGEGLSQNEITQIKEIVCEQTGISPAGIKIIERTKA